MNKLVINQNHVNQLINTLNETGVTWSDIGIEFNKLHSLKDQQHIENHIVEYVVGFGIVSEKLEDGDKVVYLVDDQEVDVTDYYQDAYFRYFEDDFE